MVKENWRERWKITTEILGLPRVPAPRLRQFHGCSYTCSTRSESISMFLSRGACSGRILTPHQSQTCTPAFSSHLLGAHGNETLQVWAGWEGRYIPDGIYPPPRGMGHAKSGCKSFLLSLLIQWKSKQISLNNWLFRAVRLQNETEE